MFTGIIEECGKIIERKFSNKNVIISVQGKKIFQDIKIGDSISVNGVCLTVEKTMNNVFTAVLSPETLSKTNLAEPSSVFVNLERAVKYGDRVGGHFLSGHIDFQTKILSLDFNDKTGIIEILIPDRYRKYFFSKGSIGIDGISLTIAEIKKNSIIIWIIPYTMNNTNISTKKAGSSVNVEIDIIAKSIVDTNYNNKIKYENRKISKESYI